VVRSAVNTVQMVDEVPMSTYAHLRRTLPYVRLVQVLHVSSEEVLDQARGCLEHVDALLLDSGRPKAHIRELGGTGRTHDWALSRRIVEMSTKPVFLAGGLNAANARDAVRLVGPWGLDVCTGVRTDGRLDPLKLRAFADAL
jgi:phosphoribosylanthranilate isomerase